MAIIGIETVLYGVDDVQLCTRYFTDFGLPLLESSDEHAHFRLDEGSNVIIRHISDDAIPKSALVGTGVCEVIWGVDRQDSLDRLVNSLAVDREVRFDADGTAHCLTDDGLAVGFRVFRKNPVYSSPDPVNSPGNINRINTQRKWKAKARPKTIQHVVFQSPDPDKSWSFYRDRLGFRLSDVQKGFGIFGRADGANDHHNVYFLNAKLPFPGLDGNLRFDHVNYGVEDLDEVMVGANYMQRRGWPKSEWGLGRHRIASSIFMYLPCPTGGQAEYGADSDYLDDSWVPRVWNPMFGFFSFIHNMAPFMLDAAPWEWEYAPGYTPVPDARLADLTRAIDPKKAHPQADVAPPQAPGFS
ncbi:VOC family protein [Azohydromonas australica]|uniref:VOC family protein n=1 Tax=Azohydromonas australica TaxID=364039 RepID=UPI00040B1A2D|nr:VOC family protein [Azohydromonas australica]